jgi:TPR repeat protein
MYKSRFLLLVSLGCIAPVQALSVECAHGDIQDTLDLNHIEPLSCASYADLTHNNEDNAVLIARLVSCAHGSNHIHYVDAHLMHVALFNHGVPSPEHAPKVLFNPINNLPLVENITYFAVYEDHAAYVGTLTDVYKQTPAGEYIQAFLGAHHSIDATERAYAQYALAQCYHTGGGVPQNMHTALYWYTKALGQTQDAVLQHHLWYALGSVYELSSDIPDHAITALTYYNKAAQNTADMQICGAAHLALGNWYSTYNHDGRKARDYYTKASRCGDKAVQAHAYAALADLYRTGFDNLPKNYAQAVTYYQRALSYAADSSLRTSIAYNSATIYYHGGFGVEKNYTRAASLFEQVAQSSNSAHALSAALALGELYRNGGYGITADARRAYELYSTVIQKSPDTSHACMATLGLAELYRADNTTIPQDRVKAQALYNQLLATCADGDCIEPMINNGLASLYCFSCSQIAADYTKACTYYLHAFNQTHDTQARAVAANGLVTLYYHGAQDYARDIEKAVEYYEYVAHQSDDLYLQAHAHQILGELYWHGHAGVRSNSEDAIKHLQQAAQQKINMHAQQVAHDALQKIHEQSLHTASRARKALTRS